MIYAPRGLGKTYVALGIACAVAAGNSFLNWQANTPRGVLYIDGEMPANLMQTRIQSIITSQSATLVAPFKLLTPDLQDRWLPDLASYPDQMNLDPYLDDVELIIVDNISTLCPNTKENDADAWAPVQEWALRMRANNRSVLFIHHAGKGGHQRGTSKREDILDSVLALHQPEDYKPSEGAKFEVHYKKARGFYGEEAKPFTAQLETLEDGNLQWTCSPAKPSTYQQVIEMTEAGCRQQDIADKLNINKSNVCRYVQRAKQENKLRSCVA